MTVFGSTEKIFLPKGIFVKKRRKKRRFGCGGRLFAAEEGNGFGKRGEGYFRLTAFGNAGKTAEAIERLVKVTASVKG